MRLYVYEDDRTIYFVKNNPAVSHIILLRREGLKRVRDTGMIRDNRTDFYGRSESTDYKENMWVRGFDGGDLFAIKALGLGKAELFIHRLRRLRRFLVQLSTSNQGLDCFWAKQILSGKTPKGRSKA
jgi:hypothetical protein